jgi:hypothetical protein
MESVTLSEVEGSPGAQSKGTHDQALFLFSAPAFELSFQGAGLSIASTMPGPDQPNRSAASCVFRPAPRVVLPDPFRQVRGNPGVISAVSALEQVAVPTLRHGQEKPFDSRACARSLRVILPAKNHGASDGIRTHDTCLGKAVLYRAELRSLRDEVIVRSRRGRVNHPHRPRARARSCARCAWRLPVPAAPGQSTQ